MTHNLIVNYGLIKMMDVCRPKLATPAQLTRFHTDDYINFLRVINPGDNMILIFKLKLRAITFAI